MTHPVRTAIGGTHAEAAGDHRADRAPTVIAAIFFLPLTAFAAVFLVLAGIGVFEWANLAGIRSKAAKVALSARYALLGYLLLNAPSSWPAVLKCVVAFWVFAVGGGADVPGQRAGAGFGRC